MLNLKILRLTAWLLLVATLLSLFSGFWAAKPFLSPGISSGLALKLHLGLMLLLFIILFYLHSLTGIFHLMKRHEILRNTAIKITVGLLWTGIILLFIYYFFAKSNIGQITNQNLNIAQPIQTPVNQNVNTAPTATNPTYTLAQISQHNSSASCWMIINNNVYNLTSYLNQHPGNAFTILPSCGQDGTQAFDAIGHSAFATNLLQNYYLGPVTR